MRPTPAVVAALLSVSTAAAQVQSPSPSPAGRISGHVVTAYAELVANATVTLGGGSRSWTATTDARGAFVFEGVPEGRYRVEASKPGYTSRQPEDGGAQPRPAFEAGLDVELADGSAIADLEILLHRAASIAGRIIQQDGSAAPGVQVVVGRKTSGGGVMLFETRTWSEFDGRYEITGLPRGEYFVAAQLGLRRNPAPTVESAESFQAGVSSVLAATAPPPDPRTVWYPGVDDANDGTSVTLLEGIDAEGIDIWLTPANRFNVSGRVFWPVGTSVENITIDYGDPEGRGSGVWFLTDPGGLFTLLGIAPGPLTMLARADTDQGPMIGMASTEVTVDSVEDVRIVVDRPGTIAGRIVYAEPVPPSARATSIVAVQKLLKVSALYPVPESPVGSDGSFELLGVIGEYEFALDGAGAGLAIQRVSRNGMLLPMNRISVAPGERVEGVEIRVGP